MFWDSGVDVENEWTLSSQKNFTYWVCSLCQLYARPGTNFILNKPPLYCLLLRLFTYKRKESCEFERNDVCNVYFLAYP